MFSRRKLVAEAAVQVTAMAVVNSTISAWQVGRISALVVNWDAIQLSISDRRCNAQSSARENLGAAVGSGDRE